MRIRSRRDLLDIVFSQLPLRTQRDAMMTGRVELLGGFSELPPNARPGWVVRLTSRYDRTWLLGVTPDDSAPVVRLRPLDAVPWEWWAGGTGNPLYDGDNPAEYERLRDRWMETPEDVGE